MSLKERIGEDMKAALRARDAERLSTIRMLIAAVKQKEIDERISLDDVQTVAVVEKLIKQRRDSIEQYEKAGRTDLADREKAEVAVLNGYLPERLSEHEVAAQVERAIADAAAQGPRDMGKVMGLLKARLAGKAEMGAVSAMVKSRLAG